MIFLSKLFLIGNGFDFQHNVHYIDPDANIIDSSLKLFSKVLKENDEDLYEKINNLIKKYNTILGGPEKELFTWNDLEKLPFRDELDIEKLTLLESCLFEWITRLDENLSTELFKQDKEKCEEYQYLKTEIFDEDTFFINFNYTATLEKIYGIDENRIFHIHGSANDSPILASIDKNQNFHWTFGYPKKINHRKPVDGLKGVLIEWLDNKKLNIEREELYVYGFNFNGYDKEYLRTVLKTIPTIKEIRFSKHQAKEIKNQEKNNKNPNNAYTNIIPIIKVHSHPINILDFEGNEILLFK